MVIREQEDAKRVEVLSSNCGMSLVLLPLSAKEVGEGDNCCKIAQGNKQEENKYNK
jgi:hypothetical protein